MGSEILQEDEWALEEWDEGVGNTVLPRRKFEGTAENQRLINIGKYWLAHSAP